MICGQSVGLVDALDELRPSFSERGAAFWRELRFVVGYRDALVAERLKRDTSFLPASPGSRRVNPETLHPMCSRLWDLRQHAGNELEVIVGSSVAISYTVEHWWPFPAVVVLGTNQAMSSLWNLGGKPSDKPSFPPWLSRWIIFLLLFGVLSKWEMPTLGWTDFTFSPLNHQRFSTHHVIAFGFFYFLSSGLYELTGRPRATGRR